MLRSKIEKWFEESIRLNWEMDSELKRKLLEGKHPRVEQFFRNMEAQFFQAQRLCRQKGIKLKTTTMQDAMYDMTKLFIKGLQDEAKKRYESDLEKAARQAKLDREKEFEDVLAGKATGEFEEAGVISNEKIDSQREAQIQKDYQSQTTS